MQGELLIDVARDECEFLADFFGSGFVVGGSQNGHFMCGEL